MYKVLTVVSRVLRRPQENEILSDLTHRVPGDATRRSPLGGLFAPYRVFGRLSDEMMRIEGGNPWDQNLDVVLRFQVP